MASDLNDLQRIGLKLFAAGGVSIRPRELVPIFHRWIQTRAIPDHLLIDVADYDHVPEGPGVVLVAHEGNFSLDLGYGQMGLAYNRKAPGQGTLAERLRSALRTVLFAARRIEEEPALAGHLRFRGDLLRCFANDRLLAPNSPATLAAFEPALAEVLNDLYAEEGWTIEAEADPRERFGVRVAASRAPDLGTLLGRLGAHPSGFRPHLSQ